MTTSRSSGGIAVAVVCLAAALVLTGRASDPESDTPAVPEASLTPGATSRPDAVATPEPTGEPDSPAEFARNACELWAEGTDLQERYRSYEQPVAGLFADAAKLSADAAVQDPIWASLAESTAYRVEYNTEEQYVIVDEDLRESLRSANQVIASECYARFDVVFEAN